MCYDIYVYTYKSLDSTLKGETMATEKIIGVVVYCSDPRTEKANLWKHIKRELIHEDERHAPVGLFGAPVALARPAVFPIKFAAVMEDIEFAIHEFSARGKIILAGHDCGIYGRIPDEEVDIETKKNDLIHAANLLRKRHIQIPVSAHFFLGSHFEQVS